MKQSLKQQNQGFSLVELMVALALVGLLAITFAGNLYSDARATARDRARQNNLEQMAIALELYKQQYGTYPDQGCGAMAGKWAGPGVGGPPSDTCFVNEYIIGLAPEFIEELPVDPKDLEAPNLGYVYRVSSDGSAYKLMAHDTVETETVTYDSPYARCPFDCGETHCDASGPQPNVYAVYSKGGEGGDPALCW